MVLRQGDIGTRFLSTPQTPRYRCTAVIGRGGAPCLGTAGEPVPVVLDLSPFVESWVFRGG